MSDSDEMQELSAVIQKAGEEVAEEYFFRCCDWLTELGMPLDYHPAPLEVWKGIAQALADTSGYTFVLKAEILESMPDQPNCRIGQREVASAEPTFFVTPA